MVGLHKKCKRRGVSPGNIHKAMSYATLGTEKRQLTDSADVAEETTVNTRKKLPGLPC